MPRLPFALRRTRNPHGATVTASILSVMVIVTVFVAVLALLAPPLGAQEPAHTEASQTLEHDAVRLLTPPGRALEGKVEVEALVIDPDTRTLVFSVDGEEVTRRNRPPWRVKVPLAKPAREQTLGVEALGPRDRPLGADRLVVNRRNPRFRARITGIDGDASAGRLTVRGEVTLPRNGVLDRVEVYSNETRVAEETTTTVEVDVTNPTPQPTDFVRLVALLGDGRQVEDVVVVSAPGIREEIDVDLVQLQVVATRKNGAPVADLTRDDFAVRQGGADREIAQFAPADEVDLMVGLVLDSSGSMRGMWSQMQAAAEEFLLNTLAPRDRAFVVDFDTQLRLVQPPTGDRQALLAALGSLEPEGGTALYDSITFSLLQFRDEPGRRALVVLSDGFDSGSVAKPERAVELGRKLGVPVYVVGFQAPAGGGGGLGGRGGVNFGATSALHTLKLLTDPTGGRLIRVAASDSGLSRAFHQIQHELRRQYVLTFYTDVLPDERGRDLRVTVPGRRDVEVRAVFGWDQIH